MRIVNAVAWGGIGALILVALLVAHRLGFVGLFLLGCLTWLISVRAGLDQRVPTWGVEVFRAAGERGRSPEERAAAAADHQAAVSPLRFFAWCGAGLAAAGAAGIAWELWAGR